MFDDMFMGLFLLVGEYGVLCFMQEVVMSFQEVSKMLCIYNIVWWGNNYYDVNELGYISVCLDLDVLEVCVDFVQLVKICEVQGQCLFVLFCFLQILQYCLCFINVVFKCVREFYGYNGDYFFVYLIKVNQYCCVIEFLIYLGELLGLEVGFKVELMVVLVYVGMICSVIVCNGYKDCEYICLVLIGEKMGYKVYLVIEKMLEIVIVLDEVERLNVVFCLGVCVCLVLQGLGKWQFFGGEKLKFGLVVIQVL